jgi:hypothetical protein
MTFGDVAQAVSTFALGAAGCLSMVKLLQTIERRRGKTEPSPDEKRRTNRLFPNGEREQIIAAIDDLQLAGRARRKEHAELKADVARIAEHLGIPL